MITYNTLRQLCQPVVIYPVLVKPLGGMNNVALFSHLQYWQEKTDCELGVHRTREELEAELGLTPDMQRTAIKKLEALGILTVTEKRLQHRTYYKLNPDAFDALMADIQAACADKNTPMSGRGESQFPEVDEADAPKSGIPMSGRGESRRGRDGESQRRIKNKDYQRLPTKITDKESNAHECATPAPEQIADKQPEKQKTKKTDLWAEGLAMLIAEGVDEAVAKDHIAFRKLKSRPLTQTALNLFRREAEKAGISIAEAVRFTTENTWTGFKAEWWERHQQGFNGAPNGFVPTVRKVEQVTQGGLRDMRTGELLPPPDVNIDDVNF